MSWATTPIGYDFHYTLSYNDEDVSEWREMSICFGDGDEKKIVENFVVDIAKELVRSGQTEQVYYHGMILSASPMSSGAFCGEVFAHEGAVCMTDIGGTGLCVAPRPSSSPCR